MLSPKSGYPVAISSDLFFVILSDCLLCVARNRRRLGNLRRYRRSNFVHTDFVFVGQDYRRGPLHQYTRILPLGDVAKCDYGSLHAHSPSSCRVEATHYTTCEDWSNDNLPHWKHVS
jgi:hypothetical protein